MRSGWGGVVAPVQDVYTHVYRRIPCLGLEYQCDNGASVPVQYMTGYGSGCIVPRGTGMTVLRSEWTATVLATAAVGWLRWCRMSQCSLCPHPLHFELNFIEEGYNIFPQPRIYNPQDFYRAFIVNVRSSSNFYNAPLAPCSDFETGLRQNGVAFSRLDEVGFFQLTTWHAALWSEGVDLRLPGWLSWSFLF